MIREVRKLRSPVTQPAAEDGSLWTQCETYVLGALRLHEAQLKGGGSPTSSSNHKDHHTNATVDDCLSLCTTFDDEDRVESPPQVTTPSFSLPRGWRLVADTLKASQGKLAIMAFTKVVFPAPEGADRINS